MKKILLFLLIFYSSYNYSYAQSKNINERIQIKKELNDSIVRLKRRISSLENKIEAYDSVYKSHFKVLSQSLDLTKKNIDDTRLRESLKSAESIINKQNSLIDGFSDIFTILTLFLGIVVPTAIYFLSIRPSNRALKKAKQKFDLKIINYNEEQINEAINNLNSNNHLLVNNSLNHILSIVPKNKFSEQQLYKLFSVAKYGQIEQNLREGIVFILSNYNFPFCKNYFFDLISEEVETIKDNNLKNYAFNYLVRFHKSKSYILSNMNQLIISSIKKKESLLVLLDLLVPDNEDLIWQLLNFKPLIDLFNLDDLNFLYKKIQEKDYIIQDILEEISNEEKLIKLKEKLLKTTLYNKIIKLSDEDSENED